MQQILTEVELVRKCKDLLNKEWDIWEEVDGYNPRTGERRRIDLIIRHKERHNFCFGVECKRPNLESYGKYTDWLKQMIVYTQVEWGRHKRRLPVLACPSIVGANDDCAYYALRRLAGKFGLGEVTFDKHYQGKIDVVKIKMSDATIWSTETGFNEQQKNRDFTKMIMSL